MPTQSERRVIGDWLKYEDEPHARYCRETVELKSTGTEYTLVSGTVLGKITSSGLYVAQNPDGAGEGSDHGAGILCYTTVVPAAGNVWATILVRGPAVVCQDMLTFSADTDLDEAALIAELEVLGIQVRRGL